MIPFTQSSSSLSRIPKEQAQSKDLRKFFKDATSKLDMDTWQIDTLKLRDELETYLLAEIRLYKAQSSVEHEMLLAELRSPSGETIYVSTERAAWKPESKEHSKLQKDLGKSNALRRSINSRDDRLTKLTKSADNPNGDRDLNEDPREDRGEDDDEDEEVVVEVEVDVEVDVEGKGDGKDDGRGDDDGHNDPLDRKRPFASGSSQSIASRLFGTPVIDYWQKLTGANFDEAIKHYEKKRSSRKGFVLRGSIEFGSNRDPNFPPTSTSNSRSAQRPNFIHFTCAALSAHRTARIYTPTINNCFWYANAVFHILKQSFPDSDLKVDKQAGTVTVAGVAVPLGGLEDEDHASLMEMYKQCLHEMHRLEGPKSSQEAELERRLKAKEEEHERELRELRENKEELERELRELRAGRGAREGVSGNASTRQGGHVL